MKLKNSLTMIFILIFVGLVDRTLTAQWYQTGNPVFLNPENFQQKLRENSTFYKVIKFFTPYCRYCRFLKDVIEQIREISPREDVLFYQFNCQDYPNQCMRFGIRSYPHMDIYGFNGQKLDALHGFHQLQLVSSWMNRAMPKNVPQKINQNVPQKPVESQAKSEPQAQVKIQEQSKSQLSVQQQQKKQAPEVKKQHIQIASKQIEKGKIQQQIPKKQVIKAPEQNKGEQKVVIGELPDTLKNDQHIEKIVDRQQQKQLKKISNQQQPRQAPIQGQKQQRNYFTLFIYIGAGLIGLYYFHHIMKSKDNVHQHDETQQDHNNTNIKANGFMDPLKQSLKKPNRQKNSTKSQGDRLEVNQSSMNDDVQAITLKQAAASVRDQDL